MSWELLSMNLLPPTSQARNMQYLTSLVLKRSSAPDTRRSTCSLFRTCSVCALMRAKWPKLVRVSCYNFEGDACYAKTAWLLLRLQMLWSGRDKPRQSGKYARILLEHVSIIFGFCLSISDMRCMSCAFWAQACVRTVNTLTIIELVASCQCAWQAKTLRTSSTW